MTNFNDNDKTTEIPDFMNDKDSADSSVDMSIFKMSDDELYDDVPKEEKRKSGKKKSNSTIVLCLVVIGILIVTSIVGIVYAMQQHNLYVTANDELTQVKAKISDYEAQVTNLTTINQQLNDQIKELQSGGTQADPNTKYAAGTKLYITEDGGSQGVREKASVDSNTVTKNGATYVLYWGDSVTLTEDATVDSSGNYWGKIDGGYIRIEYDGEIWATTEEQ